MNTRRRLAAVLLASMLLCLTTQPAAGSPAAGSVHLSDYNMHVLTNTISGVESYGQIYSDSRRWDAYAGKGENTPNEKTVTLGWAQNYGEEARALIRKIYDADRETFRSIDTCSPAIESMLSKSWTAIQWEPSASQKRVLIALITTETGKQAQDQLFAELMDKYLRQAVSYGVPEDSVAALMMWCEIEHLGGLNAVRRIFDRATKPYGIDSIMASLKMDQSDRSSNNQVGDTLFWSRHLCCSSWIAAHADTTNAGGEMQREPGELQAEAFIEAVRAVYETSNTSHYEYGDSHGNPPTSDGVISCDRLIAKALWDLGYTDQPTSTTTTSGLTIHTMPAWLSEHGWEKSTKASDIRYGSIVFTKDGSGQIVHVFAAVSEYQYGMVVKFDLGSQARIDGAQPFFEAWDAHDLAAVYNLPNLGADNPVGNTTGNESGKSGSESGSSGKSGTKSDTSATSSIKAGQKALNQYFGAALDVDGEVGRMTRTAYVNAMQAALNADYRAGLSVDGEIGPKTRAALAAHPIRKDSRGQLVTVLEIGLCLQGYDPKGIEYPGSFGDGCEKALKACQRASGLEVDGIAGVATFAALAS